MEPIKFVTGWMYSVPGKPSFVLYERSPDSGLRPFEKQLSVRTAALERKLPGGEIKGIYETLDPDEIVMLFKITGPLHCVNPQAIVDQGLMAYEDIRPYVVVERPSVPVKKAELPQKPPEKNEAPDMSLWSMDQVAKWANEQGLFIPRTRRKDDFVKRVLNAFAKKERE